MTTTSENTKTIIDCTEELIQTVKGLEKKSPQIRYLYKLALEHGYKDGPIFETRDFIIKFFDEHLGQKIRYQHVYNVLNTNLKKG